MKRKLNSAFWLSNQGHSLLDLILVVHQDYLTFVILSWPNELRHYLFYSMRWVLSLQNFMDDLFMFFIAWTVYTSTVV